MNKGTIIVRIIATVFLLIAVTAPWIISPFWLGVLTAFVLGAVAFNILADENSP